MATTCLGVAIDHRVRRLIQPTAPTTNREEGTHQDVLRARGRERGRSRAEIDVTARLAGPSTRGGIAVALQQPREKHPFERGLNGVIDDCATLAALDELFVTASGGKLSIRTNVSVIDLLPYVSEAQMKTMSDAQLTASTEAASEAFCGKEPDVVLCAGQIRIPNRNYKYDERMCETYKLESAGIGKTFDKNRTIVRLKAKDRALIRIHKVNGFHPSYSINRRAHYSCLRQLQLLTVVEACTLARRDKWVPEGWMQVLRDTCAGVVESTMSPASSPKSRQTQSPQPEQASKQMALYLPDYEKLYSALLPEIKAVVLSFMGPGFQNNDDNLYDRLLRKKLSALCNDVSLILFEMSKLEDKGWDARFDQWNLDTLRKAAQSTLNFVQRPKASTGLAMGSANWLKTILNNALVRIHSTIDSYGLDLRKASVEFLTMAVNIESFLLQLLDEETAGPQQEVPESGQDLATAIGGMSLGVKAGTTVTVTPATSRYTARA